MSCPSYAPAALAVDNRVKVEENLISRRQGPGMMSVPSGKMLSMVMPFESCVVSMLLEKITQHAVPAAHIRSGSLIPLKQLGPILQYGHTY